MHNSKQELYDLNAPSFQTPKKKKEKKSHSPAVDPGGLASLPRLDNPSERCQDTRLISFSSDVIESRYDDGRGVLFFLPFSLPPLPPPATHQEKMKRTRRPCQCRCHLAFQPQAFFYLFSPARHVLIQTRASPAQVPPVASHFFFFFSLALKDAGREPGSSLGRVARRRHGRADAPFARLRARGLGGVRSASHGAVVDVHGEPAGVPLRRDGG